MRARNEFDDLARTVAFEIILGGDRLEPSDVSERLDGCSESELGIFRDRVRYHCVDFAPPEYRTEDFVGRQIAAWTDGVRSRSDKEVAEAGLRVVRAQVESSAGVNDRGKWFRFPDGHRKCLKATVYAMWGADEVSCMVSDKPVPAVEVLRDKADALISCYGRRVDLDGPCDSLDVSSYGLDFPRGSMSVRRRVDILCGTRERVFFVTTGAYGNAVSSAIDSLTDADAEMVIRYLDRERDLRVSIGVASGRQGESEGVIVGLGEGVVVQGPDDASYGGGFKVSSVYCDNDGNTLVSGRYLIQSRSEPEYNYPLTALTDKGLSDVRKAMDVSMRRTLDSLAKVESVKTPAALRSGRKSGLSL